MGLIKVSVRDLNNINWLSSAQCKFAINNNIVDVWKINISSNLSILDDFLSIMRPDEIARANKYFHIKDKNRFIVSRGGLRNILGKYLNQFPASIEFVIGENKKPYVVNPGKINVHYNISHSGDWILFAISNSAIGTDVEFVNHDFNYDEIIDDNFSIDEVKYIKQGIPAESFFMLWTRKESLTKATGKGLDENIKSIPCLEGVHFAESTIISSQSDLFVSSFKINEQYVASIATDNLPSEANFWGIDFTKPIN
jgi:4'-phosphopantetheinyl transferase